MTAVASGAGAGAVAHPSPGADSDRQSLRQACVDLLNTALVCRLSLLVERPGGALGRALGAIKIAAAAGYRVDVLGPSAQTAAARRQEADATAAPVAGECVEGEGEREEGEEGEEVEGGGEGEGGAATRGGAPDDEAASVVARVLGALAVNRCWHVKVANDPGVGREVEDAMKKMATAVTTVCEHSRDDGRSDIAASACLDDPSECVAAYKLLQCMTHRSDPLRELRSHAQTRVSAVRALMASMRCTSDCERASVHDQRVSGLFAVLHETKCATPPRMLHKVLANGDGTFNAAMLDLVASNGTTSLQSLVTRAPLAITAHAAAAAAAPSALFGRPSSFPVLREDRSTASAPLVVDCRSSAAGEFFRQSRQDADALFLRVMVPKFRMTYWDRVVGADDTGFVEERLRTEDGIAELGECCHTLALPTHSDSWRARGRAGCWRDCRATTCISPLQRSTGS